MIPFSESSFQRQISKNYPLGEVKEEIISLIVSLSLCLVPQVVHLKDMCDDQGTQMCEFDKGSGVKVLQLVEYQQSLAAGLVSCRGGLSLKAKCNICLAESLPL